MFVRTPIVLISVLCSGLACWPQQSATYKRVNQSAPCAETRQKQFDFWLGDWNLTWSAKDGGTRHGTNHITEILGGCAIEEEFTGGSLRAMSVSTFDPRSGKWKQTWVDNGGSSVDFEGGFDHGQMTLEREATGPDGTKVLQRMVYKNITAEAFDWSWERSQDGGRTWQVLWPIHYQRNSTFLTR